jgi:hypothetical protein
MGDERRSASLRVGSEHWGRDWCRQRGVEGRNGKMAKVFTRYCGPTSALGVIGDRRRRHWDLRRKAAAGNDTVPGGEQDTEEAESKSG